MRISPLIASGLAVVLLTGCAAAAVPKAPAPQAAHKAVACTTPHLENQAHTPHSTSDAWLLHGVQGTVLNVTGGIVAVQAPNMTIATVYVPGGHAGVRPGQTVQVTGTLRNGLIWAKRMRLTGGHPWPAPTTPVQPTHQIRHVIFVIQENHSFDNYFGTYPGVVGLKPGIKLPAKRGGPPAVAPYHLTAPLTHDLAHNWSNAHRAYAGGKMNGFVWADQYRDVMGYYTAQDIPNYWDYAQHFTLDDMFFAALLGPSLPNHLYTVAGTSGGWIWNMWAPPTPCGWQFPTLAGQLQAKGVSWKDYNGYPPQQFWLWNPLPGFATFKASASLRSHLVWNTQFFQDLRSGQLPAFSWITPDMLDSEHPPTNYALGMWYVTDLLNAVGESPYWNDTLVVVTWDEYGGFYDNVKPPQIDRYGFGFRVPTLEISPYVGAGRIDSTVYGFSSVLRYEEASQGLPPLTARVAKVNSIGSSLNLRQAPLPPLLITAPVPASAVPRPNLP
jgi:phospholipase C